ncbi:MAG TPA: methyltransferase domain-containing protein [Kribbella sp.]|jgi:SAM-dependent methyltransferase
MSQTVPDVAGHDDYSLGNSNAELSRLMIQSDFLKGVTDLLLERIGVIAGWRALDMGCGPLGALPSLVERAGPDNVVGLERDPGFAGKAMRLLAERGFDAVQVIQGDAVQTGLDANCFDLVHERTLLINSPHPSEVVAEMVRLARPGGYVALQDFDVAGLLCIPPHPDYDRLMSAVAKVWSGDMFIGRRLASLLSAAGLLGIQVDAHVFLLAAGDPHYDQMLDFFELHRNRIIGANLLAPNEFEVRLRSARDHFNAPTTRFQYGPLFQAWGRKPG